MKRQTYNQAQKNTIFDWTSALQTAVFLKTLAKPKKGFNREPQENAYQTFSDELALLAGDWVTCACGNQCSILERDDNGAPWDRQLYTLGLDFSKQVDVQNWSKAKRILEKIERRSAKLITQKLKTSH